MYKNIFINQCGYLPEMEKKVTFRIDHEMSFVVCKSDGSQVFQGIANKRVDNKASNEINYIGDFSSLKEEGTYYIIGETLGESDTFHIRKDVYDSVLQDSMKFFYLQRCGCDLPASAAGIYAHKACHTSLASIYNESNKKEVSGGWHDAGDYGRYIVPAAMAIAQLLMAYEKNEAFCAQYQNDYDGQNKALPAFLEEIKYELDWMLKLQREDGKVYHKATCYHFCGFIMPENELEEIVLSPVSVTATADFAAVTAMAIRFYKKYDKEYALLLESASKKAYQALDGFHMPGGFKNPKEITTGEYDDEIDIDELYWASAELYKAFGDETYRLDFEKIANEKIYHGYGWRDMGSFANIAYLTTTYPISADLKEKIQKEIIRIANERLEIANQDGYATALTEKEYIWGSNLEVANHGIQLFDAYEITHEQKYLDAASAQIHYLLGRNPMGISYLTGTGTNPMKHPHHRPSGFLGKAMPGMLSGGPCDWFADETIKNVLIKENTAPAKSFVDMTGSYSTNEVTIYWNSAFIQLLAYIMN